MPGEKQGMLKAAEIADKKRDHCLAESNKWAGSQGLVAQWDCGAMIAAEIATAIRAAAASLPSDGEGWLPIESAPKVQTQEMRGVYSDDGTPGMFAFRATHWRPSPPKADKEVG